MDGPAQLLTQSHAYTHARISSVIYIICHFWASVYQHSVNLLIGVWRDTYVYTIQNARTPKQICNKCCTNIHTPTNSVRIIAGSFPLQVCLLESVLQLVVSSRYWTHAELQHTHIYTNNCELCLGKEYLQLYPPKKDHEIQSFKMIYTRHPIAKKWWVFFFLGQKLRVSKTCINKLICFYLYT